MHSRSVALQSTLEVGLDRILLGWVLIAALACAARIAITSPPAAGVAFGAAMPYLLVMLAPVISIALALRWFAGADARPQPTARRAFPGRWRILAPTEARNHPLYGTSGLMVSLLVGLLLNVAIRAAEFLAAIPPVFGRAPEWLSTLQVAMTFDAALRRLPSFPRLLVAIWIGDIAMQLAIGHVVAASPHLPLPVAAALHDLLLGNANKVLISVALWLPYLLLSARVNVTYRHRVPA
jgi:hypothetical protein